MNSNSKKTLTLLLATSLLLAPAAKKASAEVQNNISDSVVYSSEEKKDVEIIYHKVKKGENLSRISRKYYGDTCYWKELSIYNNIVDPSFIKKESIIKVPKNLDDLLGLCYHLDEEEEKYHLVQKGDTLSEICELYYGTKSDSVIWKLATYNNLFNPNYIRKGQELKIPPYEKLKKVDSRDYSACFPYPNPQLPKIPHICDEHCYTEADMYDSVTDEYLGKTRILKPHTY